MCTYLIVYSTKAFTFLNIINKNVNAKWEFRRHIILNGNKEQKEEETFLYAKKKLTNRRIFSYLHQSISIDSAQSIHITQTLYLRCTEEQGLKLESLWAIVWSRIEKRIFTIHRRSVRKNWQTVSWEKSVFCKWNKIQHKIYKRSTKFPDCILLIWQIGYAIFATILQILNIIYTKMRWNCIF